MHANDPKDALERDLFAIYENAGREVTYVTDRGERRPYWANRFRQALQRAVNDQALVEFVERLMTTPEPSRGFGYLKDAGRLDLTVEALVVDTAKPYHALFSAEALQAASERLKAHGWPQPAPAGPRAAPPTNPPTGTTFTPGDSFDLRVTVGADGTLAFRLL